MTVHRSTPFPAILIALATIVLSTSTGTQLLFAQTESEDKARITGRVLDSSGAAIVDARIIAVPQDPGTESSTHSDENGEFSLAVSPGKHTIRVTAKGFQTTDKTLMLLPNVSERHEFTLRVAGSINTIIVTGDPGYRVEVVSSATKTTLPIRDIPQSVSVVARELMRDQMMMSMADVVRYMPGITTQQGENNRDQLVIRGNTSSADFFLNGIRDDMQYYRDLYNLERVEALKGPNAMVFGRGGGGGVVNRVTKEAGFTPLREIAIMGGSYGFKRLAGDVDQPLGEKVALRFNGVYENSNTFRDFVGLERYGVNPTLTILPSSNTRLTIGYEHFRDHRVADRGIPSYQGRPVDVDISTYFGNPFDSNVRANVNLGSVGFEYRKGPLGIRNSTLFGAYDRRYQNYVPGAVTADKQRVAISAYNNTSTRQNIFNQTDVTYVWFTRRIRHTLLAGTEFGGQSTDNFRNTGYFNNTITTFLAPYANPVISVPVTFRQSATDADNHVQANVQAVYMQDQVSLTRRLQLLAGLRFDRFNLDFHNNRTSSDLERVDHLVSPRLGIVFHPAPVVSIYGSYSVSHLPSAGDQFSSLTNVTQQLKPEEFTNYEIGAKWDISRYLELTVAGYRLDRTNTRSTDPNDPTRIVQTGSQRTNGFEVGVNGTMTRKWKIVGGYAWQDAFITSGTTVARTGAQVAQVPHHTFSLWNNYQVIRRLGVGLGLVGRTRMFAAVDNTVTLPGYLRTDAAVFFSVTEKIRLQANVENLLGKTYYVNADNNNNISPGYPVAVRVGLVWRF